MQIQNSEPSIYTMDHPDLAVSNFMEKSIDLQRSQMFPCIQIQMGFCVGKCSNCLVALSICSDIALLHVYLGPKILP